MAEPEKPKTPAELAAENKLLRDQLDSINRQKAIDNTPGWFRCSHSELPGHMSVVVQANGKQDAILQFCIRMGIQWTVKRGQEFAQVAADKVKPADLETGRPLIGSARINVEPMGSKRPDIAQHVRVHPGTGVKQVVYSREELVAAGYKPEEVEQVA